MDALGSVCDLPAVALPASSSATDIKAESLVDRRQFMTLALDIEPWPTLTSSRHWSVNSVHCLSSPGVSRNLGEPLGQDFSANIMSVRVGMK